MLWRCAFLFVLLPLAVGCRPSPEQTGEPQKSPPAAGDNTESEEVSQSEPAARAEEFTHVIAIDSAYYADGPQQSRPPDGTLKTGTRVRVIQNSGSYSVVRTADGIECYVSTGVIAPAEDAAAAAGK